MADIQRQKRERKKRELCTVQGGDAADCVVLEIAVTFDKRVVVCVIDGDAVGDGNAGAKVAARVPFLWRLDLPSREDGVQSFRCCFIPYQRSVIFKPNNFY